MGPPKTPLEVQEVLPNELIKMFNFSSSHIGLFDNARMRCATCGGLPGRTLDPGRITPGVPQPELVFPSKPRRVYHGYLTPNSNQGIELKNP